MGNARELALTANSGSNWKLEILMANDYPELPPEEKERVERREKKRRPKMHISGRSVLNLVRIVREKARGERPLTSKSAQKKRKKHP